MDNLFQCKESEQYINLLQQNINRMASNSSSCKNWMITIVTAIIGIACTKQLPIVALLAVIPIILFWIKDCFYLGYERSFIDIEKQFVKDAKISLDKEKDGLYAFAPQKRFSWDSFSTTPIYVVTLVLIILCFCGFKYDFIK